VRLAGQEFNEGLEKASRWKQGMMKWQMACKVEGADGSRGVRDWIRKGLGSAVTGEWCRGWKGVSHSLGDLVA
jgi:hypothetical protein